MSEFYREETVIHEGPRTQRQVRDTLLAIGSGPGQLRSRCAVLAASGERNNKAPDSIDRPGTAPRADA